MTLEQKKRTLVEGVRNGKYVFADEQENNHKEFSGSIFTWRDKRMVRSLLRGLAFDSRCSRLRCMLCDLSKVRPDDSLFSVVGFRRCSDRFLKALSGGRT